MATAKQRAWRAKFAAMYGGGRKKRSRSRRPVRSESMARRKGFRRSGGNGTGRLLNAALFAAGAAFIAPRLGVNVDPKLIGAGVGYWKGGLIGAGIGYFVPTFIGSALGGSNTSTTNTNGSW